MGKKGERRKGRGKGDNDAAEAADAFDGCRGKVSMLVWVTAPIRGWVGDQWGILGGATSASTFFCFMD
jgi:hypothetical protein